MNVVLFSVGNFPAGDAGSVRTTALAKLLKLQGHNPIVVGLKQFKEYQTEEHDGISYVSLKPRMRHYAESAKEFLESLSVKPDVIWIYWVPLNAFLFLKKYAARNHILLVHDSVEWYSRGQKGRFSYIYYEKDFVNKHVIDKHFRVVAISRYLQQYFSGKKIPTIRIPAVLDVENIEFQKAPSDDMLRLMYAGSPHNKDRLDIVLQGMTLLNEEQLQHVCFTVIGISDEQLLACYPALAQYLALRKAVSATGRVPREQVLKFLQKADFTVLLRPSEERYAKAGFPTKVAESMASATPVIANVSSDLELYLRDRVNSMVVGDCSAESFCKTLKAALLLTPAQKDEMKQQSRKTAEESFDYRSYQKQMTTLLG